MYCVCHITVLKYKKYVCVCVCVCVCVYDTYYII